MTRDRVAQDMGTATTTTSVWVEHLPGNGGFGMWAVLGTGAEGLQQPAMQGWIGVASSLFSEQPETASISVVYNGGDEGRRTAAGAEYAIADARAAVLPICFFNGRVADLIGLTAADARQSHPVTRFEAWAECATVKGLGHLWLRTERASDAMPPALSLPAPTLTPWRSLAVGGRAAARPISLGIDAAGLLGGISGAQVLVFEMVRELVQRPEIAHITFLSKSGGIPASLKGLSKISGCSWAQVVAGQAPMLDILHRPSQPDADVDFSLYRRAARCVSMTVLDFIAYDNHSYHESKALWRDHQVAFDDRVRWADTVLAISRHVADRLERQFAHQLAAPVQAIHLGTDHLDRAGGTEAAPAWSGAMAPLAERRFTLVLGNDFEHKNRDFAVKVFQDMSARGYDGLLVLAGFHLDNGSSFHHELPSGSDGLDRIVRIGAVSEADKTALLRRADVVLYPTSSEGFGLIPFEAAALGTPTAFVSFGPFRETLPGVRACAGWRVREFADLALQLIADPAVQIAEIRTAGAALTWRKCADAMIETFQGMLDDSTPWQTERRSFAEPRLIDRAAAVLTSYSRRVERKAQRLGLRSK
jgi:glycosyltransferase involved in cell wall biosynthesis